MTKRQRITVRQPPRDSSRYRGPHSRDVCLGVIVLARLQEKVSGLWFWYGMAIGRENTAHRPDHYDAVKAEAVAACKVWLKEQK